MLRNGSEKKTSEKPLALSYFSKTKIVCPICDTSFQREEMLTGSGRLNAGELTEELHRLYIPTAKYGKVYPLIYSVGACPNCHAAFMWNDFAALKDASSIQKISDTTDERKSLVASIFPHYDLERNRTLLDGAAIHFLSILSYDNVPYDLLPTIKRALLTLRLAWLCSDLNEEMPGHNYDLVSQMFYQKASFFYSQAIENETKRIEKSSTLQNMGPDTDKNYGWDGVIYLCALLEYKYGQKDDVEFRMKRLDELKISIAKIFGLGKSSKEKPGPLLEHSRNLYDALNSILKNADFGI